MKESTSKRELKNIGSVLLLMLGILCLLYGLVIVLAGSGTTFFLVWFGLGILFMILALLKKKNLFGKVPRKLKNISFILLLVCLIIFLITEGLIASHFSDRGEQNTDYLIVLGRSQSGTSLSTGFCSSIPGRESGQHLHRDGRTRI